MLTSAPDCPFCSIVAGTDRDVREVYRDDNVIVFFPTEPATLGHTMIIPRRHVETVIGLRESELIALALISKLIAHGVHEALSPDGINIIQSNGSIAEQTVPHVHVHVVPRWSEDPIGPIWPPDTNYSEEAKDGVLATLKNRVQQLKKST